MIGTGYSLWLMTQPDELTGQKLAKLISRLGTVYDTPLFPPHVTLLSDVEQNEEAMKKTARVLAQTLSSYPIELNDLGSNGLYFQILFAKAHCTPQVMTANAQAQCAFGLQRPSYFPHLSLAYGDLTPEQVVHLTITVRRDAPWVVGTVFPVAQIQLWATIGPIQDWRYIETYPLK